MCHKKHREQKTGRQLKPTYPQIPQEYLTFGVHIITGRAVVFC